MRLVAQRVSRASVSVGGEVIGEIGAGVVLFVCAMAGDGPSEARRLAERLAHFRFFPDPADPGGRMGRSALDAGAACLVVSQFTLAADGRKGRRPSFDRAAPPELARALVEAFRAALEELGLATAEGRFGAEMVIELVHEGPVTFVLDQDPARK